MTSELLQMLKERWSYICRCCSMLVFGKKVLWLLQILEQTSIVLILHLPKDFSSFYWKDVSASSSIHKISILLQNKVAVNWLKREKHECQYWVMVMPWHSIDGRGYWWLFSYPSGEWRSWQITHSAISVVAHHTEPDCFLEFCLLLLLYLIVIVTTECGLWLWFVVCGEVGW